MSETDKEVIEEKEVVVEEEVVSPSKQEALSGGWKPEQEWIDSGGDPEKWVDYGEFNRRKEFFDAIHKANQRAKKAEESAEALSRHLTQVQEAAYKRAKEELLAERRAAAKENDLEKVLDIDEQLDSLKAPEEVAPTRQRAPELEEFAKRNKWYDEDEDLQAYANGIGGTIERNNPNMPTSEVLQLVEEKVKKAFPHKFKNSTTAPVSSVASARHAPTTQVTRKKRITYNDLPDDAKKMYNMLVKDPVKNPRGKLTPDQYLKDYALVAGLPYEE